MMWMTAIIRLFCRRGTPYYDPSYRHDGGLSYGSLAGLAAAVVEKYYYDRKFVFTGAGFVEEPLPRGTIPGPSPNPVTVAPYVGPYIEFPNTNNGELQL